MEMEELRYARDLRSSMWYFWKTDRKEQSIEAYKKSYELFRKNKQLDLAADAIEEMCEVDSDNVSYLRDCADMLKDFNRSRSVELFLKTAQAYTDKLDTFSAGRMYMKAASLAEGDKKMRILRQCIKLEEIGGDVSISVHQEYANSLLILKDYGNAYREFDKIIRLVDDTRTYRFSRPNLITSAILCYAADILETENDVSKLCLDKISMYKDIEPIFDSGFLVKLFTSQSKEEFSSICTEHDNIHKFQYSLVQLLLHIREKLFTIDLT